MNKDRNEDEDEDRNEDKGPDQKRLAVSVSKSVPSAQQKEEWDQWVARVQSDLGSYGFSENAHEMRRQLNAWWFVQTNMFALGFDQSTQKPVLSPTLPPYISSTHITWTYQNKTIPLEVTHTMHWWNVYLRNNETLPVDMRRLAFATRDPKYPCMTMPENVSPQNWICQYLMPRIVRIFVAAYKVEMNMHTEIQLRPIPDKHWWEMRLRASPPDSVPSPQEASTTRKRKRHQQIPQEQITQDQRRQIEGIDSPTTGGQGTPSDHEDEFDDEVVSFLLESPSLLTNNNKLGPSVGNCGGRSSIQTMIKKSPNLLLRLCRAYFPEYGKSQHVDNLPRVASTNPSFPSDWEPYLTHTVHMKTTRETWPQFKSCALKDSCNTLVNSLLGEKRMFPETIPFSATFKTTPPNSGSSLLFHFLEELESPTLTMETLTRRVSQRKRDHTEKRQKRPKMHKIMKTLNEGLSGDDDDDDDDYVNPPNDNDDKDHVLSRTLPPSSHQDENVVRDEQPTNEHTQAETDADTTKKEWFPLSPNYLENQQQHVHDMARASTESSSQRNSDTLLWMK